MTVIRLTIFLILSTLIVIMACDDSPTRHTNFQPPFPPEFPGFAGMLWKYEVFDSLNQITDTVWVSYTDNSFVSNGDFYVTWKEKHFADTSFEIKAIRANKDTIDILTYDTLSVKHIERLIYPLELGKSWPGVMADDDTSRVYKGSITILNGLTYFGDRIDRSWNLDIDGGGNWSQTWMVPELGIVSRYFLSQFSDGSNVTVTKNETWKLIEYDLRTFEIGRFPNKVGNQWIYEEKDSVYYHHDSVIITYDTVTVTIVDKGQLETGDKFTVWEYANKLVTDTQFVVTHDNFINFMYDTSTFSVMNITYEFPLAVGKYWDIETIYRHVFQFAPTPEVLDKDTVMTPFQTFTSAFHIKINGGAFNDYWTQDDWLVPNLGIVKSTRWQYGFIPSMNRTRTLIDYTLVD